MKSYDKCQKVAFLGCMIISEKLLALIFFFLFHIASAQHQQTLLRFYVDNDFLVYQKKDGAYTSGVRLDLFITARSRYRERHTGLYFVSEDDAIHTKYFGIQQIMFTPNDIRIPDPAEGEYPYSGSVLLHHGVWSDSKRRGLSLYTQYTLALMGPVSLADKTQIEFHRLIGDDPPMGWKHQFDNAVLANFKVSAERQ